MTSPGCSGAWLASWGVIYVWGFNPFFVKYLYLWLETLGPWGLPQALYKSLLRTRVIQFPRGLL